MWDTAGQEQFRSLAPVYTRSSSAVVIVVSINEISSFQSIGDWVDIVRATSEKMPPIILCVNKIDLPDHVKQFEDIVEKYKPSFEGVFFVSALTGQEVDNAFRCASEKAYKFVIENQAVDSKKLDEVTEKKSSCC
jgi:small GTP-binding protein